MEVNFGRHTSKQGLMGLSKIKAVKGESVRAFIRSRQEILSRSGVRISEIKVSGAQT